MNPMVSFVVPCYKLAHLLRECVDSILAQTYTDFEVLIMDDFSPDNTPEVAQSFNDPRVKHIRNEPNLGHLRNYNKGVELARGKYIWLISADDRLRVPYVLQRYVEFFESHPKVGYVFCAGVGLENGEETNLLKDFWWGDRDRIVNGRKFVSRLLQRRGGILSPSNMVRKECYEKVSMFPVDMPHQGDLYLWCVWAFHYDVAYFAEPMVAYRLHDLNIMKALKRKNHVIIVLDQLAVQWRVKRKAAALGCSSVTKRWISVVADLYVFCLVSKQFDSSPYHMTFADFESSLQDNTSDIHEIKRIRSRVYAGFGDGCFRHGDLDSAQSFYLRGLSNNRWMPKVWAKLLLLRTGHTGTLVRKGLVALNSGS